MLISHRRKPRRLVPLLVATAVILAMNSPGLTALAGEVATSGDDPTVILQEDVAADVGEPLETPEVPAPADPGDESVPPSDEVVDSIEAAPVTVEVTAMELAAAAVIAPSAIEPLDLPYASVGKVKLQGLTLLAPGGWTNGDVKGYYEGQWIPFRLEIDNTAGNAVTVQVPSTVYTVDHIVGGAVAVDATANWRWAVDGGAATPFDVVTHDDDSDPALLRTTLPEAAGFTLDKGETGYIYFEAHLALTPYWMPLAGLYGASGYPGSSAHARLVEWNDEGIGDKASPFIVGPKLASEASLCGLKFEDLDADGIKDAGEGPLGGWEFSLEYQDPTYSFELTATSASDGTFSFADLPPGKYVLSEVPKDGYTLITDLSGEIAIAADQQVGPIEVGNAPAMVDKTWSLALSAAVPKADSYFVRYVIGGASHDLALTPGVDSKTKVPWGTTITSWQFFAMMGAEEIPLSGVLGPAERLVEDRTNSFTFDPGEISGRKLIGTLQDNTLADTDWTIKLYRSGVLYAQTTTVDGAYSFAGLLPGEYKIEEVEQPDYLKLWPVGSFLGPFTVVSGSAFSEGTDFINGPRPVGITVTKTADPIKVHVGDTITYTIDVTNNGQVAVTLKSVVDPMLGGDVLVGDVELAPGQSLSDLGLEIVKDMAAPDQDAVDNTVLATADSVFGPVMDSDDAHVDILRPDIEVTKVVVPDAVVDSDLVTYYVTVTNSGNTTLTVDVNDYIGAVLHRVVATDLMLGPGDSQDYEWDETVTMPVEDTVVATGVDELGGDKGTVSAEDSASVAVDVTKTFTLTVYDLMPKADSYFVRYEVLGESFDLSLLSGVDDYSASVILPYGTTITTWQIFAMMGAEEVPLSSVMGPETLEGPLTNSYGFVPGEIGGVKYNDLDGSGTRDEGELGLPGWTIELYRDGVSYDTTVTADGGAYQFSGLLPGTYTLTEVQQPGWEMTDSPSEIVVGNESVVGDADFGNHHLDVTKTFQLTYTNPPAETQFSVVYQLAEGDPVTVPLTGTGPYVGTDEIPWGSTIVAVWWMAEYQGQDIVLGVEEPEETLTEDMLNEFTYTASVSGFKFEDFDGNGVWDKPDELGLADWTIGLYRLSSQNDIIAALPVPELGFELYAQTLTAADGSYTFGGLLPGTYYVAEEQQDGWEMTVSPAGTFLVVDGVALTELNFGNYTPILPFTATVLEKKADKKTADPGDLVTYTLTYYLAEGSASTEATITDDYDERYMEPVDIAGATQGAGILTWHDSVPLETGDVRTITYTMRIIEDMPTTATRIDNVAVITPNGNEATWRVTVSNPFLPFTGGTLALLALLAAAALLIGIALRERAHSV